MLNRLLFGQVVRFGIVGVAATLIHAAVLYAAVEAARLTPAIANGMAFAVAVFVTYAGQSLWVFRVDRHSARAMRRFIASALFGLGANIALMAICVDLLALDYRIGFVVAVIVVPAMSFVINRCWVFASHDDIRTSGSQ